MNVVLIGMPGCGKSTYGVLAAKRLCMSFLDTDLLLQQNEQLPLQSIINERGGEYFLHAEEKTVLSLYTRNCIIATGGSVVYSDAAMRHLGEDALVIFLNISYNGMCRRIRNLSSRGILLKSGNTLRDMYDERLPLYKKYADVTIDCDNSDIEGSVAALVAAVLERTNGV